MIDSTLNIFVGLFQGALWRSQRQKSGAHRQVD